MSNRERHPWISSCMPSATLSGFLWTSRLSWLSSLRPRRWFSPQDARRQAAGRRPVKLQIGLCTHLSDLHPRTRSREKGPKNGSNRPLECVLDAIRGRVVGDHHQWRCGETRVFGDSLPEFDDFMRYSDQECRYQNNPGYSEFARIMEWRGVIR